MLQYNMNNFASVRVVLCYHSRGSYDGSCAFSCDGVCVFVCRPYFAPGRGVKNGGGGGSGGRSGS